jgi:hypothetical protein
MPLNARYIGVSVAVICFFGLSFISWFSGLSTFVCCKRAFTGALIAYIVVTLSVNTVNTILTNAMIMSRLNRDKDTTSGSKD